MVDSQQILSRSADVVLYIWKSILNFGTVRSLSKNSRYLVQLKQLILSLWGQYLVKKNTEQNMKLLSIKSIYFSQELFTDIALYGVTITLSRDKASLTGNSLDKETSTLEIWSYCTKICATLKIQKILYKIPTLNVNNLQRNVYLEKMTRQIWLHPIGSNAFNCWKLYKNMLRSEWICMDKHHPVTLL